MLDRTPRFASLTPDQEQKLHDLEKDLGDVYVLAYEPSLVPARLADEKIQEIQETEKDLGGVVLVAYQKPR